MLVRRPTEDVLNWHEDAVAEVFNLTGGNPYFANILCASVFDSAVRGRDGDITAEEVRLAVASEVPSFDSNSFAHLWQDGIAKRADEREPDVLRRCRVLVAIARCLRRRLAINLDNLLENREGLNIVKVEVAP